VIEIRLHGLKQYFLQNGLKTFFWNYGKSRVINLLTYFDLK
jgi:hypothetical protein